MPEAFQAARPTLSSLATKTILFVCSCSVATALVVSWAAVQESHAHLAASLNVRLEGNLTRAGDAVASWQQARSTEGPLENVERAELRALLDRERSIPTRLLLVDAGGSMLAAGANPGEPAPARVPSAALRGSGVREYTAVTGTRWTGRARALAGGWRLVAEERIERAFAPVAAVVTRIFAVDLALILLFSLLAYRVTTTAVRPLETLAEAARRIARGQFDHELPEPERTDEVGLLTRTFNDMLRRLRGYQGEIEAANQSLKERNVELQQAKETFEQLSITDGLTRLHNHRFFQDHLTREIKRAIRSGEPLCMLLIDIDDFKSLNDRFGHAAGDELLSDLARIMNDTVRDSDLLARYGGEEFVILAANTDIEGSYRLAEKIRTSISEASFALDASPWPARVTVSIGVARYRGNRKTFFRAADGALYRAKAEGKNGVVVDEAEDLA